MAIYIGINHTQTWFFFSPPKRGSISECPCAANERVHRGRSLNGSRALEEVLQVHAGAKALAQSLE